MSCLPPSPTSPLLHYFHALSTLIRVELPSLAPLPPPPSLFHTCPNLYSGGLVSELDPDAPGRQGKGLQADNAKAEERLLVRLWQLVRAGEGGGGEEGR